MLARAARSWFACCSNSCRNNFSTLINLPSCDTEIPINVWKSSKFLSPDSTWIEDTLRENSGETETINDKIPSCQGKAERHPGLDQGETVFPMLCSGEWGVNETKPSIPWCYLYGSAMYNIKTPPPPPCLYLLLSTVWPASTQWLDNIYSSVIFILTVIRDVLVDTQNISFIIIH